MRSATCRRLTFPFALVDRLELTSRFPESIRHNKAYGIRTLRNLLNIPIVEMIYAGDVLFPGGNDHPARGTGAACIQVRDPDETRRVTEAITDFRNPT